jgi:hypothetical protein
MAVSTIGAGLELATTLLNLVAPSVSQEQKEILLDEYKKRVAELQAACNAIAAKPDDRAAQLDLGRLTDRLLNAAGFTAPGLASLDLEVPLDDYLQLLTVCSTLILVLEQQQLGKGEA